MNDPLGPIFEALGDTTRRRVLVSLAADGAATATQLASAFPVTRQAVAKHLQVLLEAGVVVAERRGRETLFAFVPGSLGPLARWIGDVDSAGAAERWDDQVVALRRHLEEQQARRGLSPAPGPLRAAASARPPRPSPA